jgi:polyhydroxyalkanoate synthase
MRHREQASTKKLIPASDAPHVDYRDVAERTLVTAMTINPLAAMDRSQIVAAWVRVLARALVRPGALARRSANFAAEVAAIIAGSNERAPASGDRQFSDPAFTEHPLYRRLMQLYFAWRDGIHALVDELELDPKSHARGRFALRILTDALAPTNALVGNPQALKRAFETGGRSLLRGARQMLHDVIDNGGMPAQVNRQAFRVGENLALTPGQVVFRSDVLELIQYAPTTANVYARPLMMIPPQINKYYILDLAPRRSLIEYAVGRGFQTFAVSWRNPTAAQRDWGLGTYVQALREASDVARAITGADKLNVLGACAGGITTAVLLGHLAARGDDRVASATFPVTVLDTSVESAMDLLASEKSIAAALERSRRKGVLSGREMARVFAWLRPNDLVWSYWVNNYLLGEPPPAFDILYWNNDATNLPATLHAEFLEIFVNNSLCHPGSLEVLDTPIDLGKVQADVYAVGALSDHITPWQACYRTPRLFGGKRTFVESTSGHIQAIVNPPGNAKALFLASDTYGPDAQEWLEGAREHRGSWWDHWTAWLIERSGPSVTAPTQLGSEAHPPLMAAPGRYVHQRATA